MEATLLIELRHLMAEGVGILYKDIKLDSVICVRHTCLHYSLM